MKPAFERFLDADDRLSALLQALPAYEAGGGLEAAAIAGMREQAARQAKLPLEADYPLRFEPPPEMETALLQEARQIDQAQQTRRAALLAEIAAGQAPAQALGAPLQATTANLLQKLAAQTPDVEKPERRRPGFRFAWRDLGLMASAAAIAVIATHLYLRTGESPADATPQVASIQPDAAPVPPTGDSPPVQIANLDNSAGEIRARAPSKSGTPPANATARLTEADLPAKTAMVTNQESAVPDASATDEVTPGPAKAKVAQLALSERLLPETSRREEAPPELARPAAPASAAPSQEATAGKRILHKELKARAAAEPLQSCLIISLKYDPEVIANHLDMTRCGSIQRLRTANPDSAIAQEWAERFRKALPADAHAGVLPLDKDAKVPLDLISIDALPARED